MLNKQQIRTIIKAQGFAINFRENVGKGDGTSKTYVRASKYVSRLGNVHIALGPIESVTQMSQNDLIEKTKQEFARKLERKNARGRIGKVNTSETETKTRVKPRR